MTILVRLMIYVNVLQSMNNRSLHYSNLLISWWIISLGHICWWCNWSLSSRSNLISSIFRWSMCSDHHLSTIGPRNNRGALVELSASGSYTTSNARTYDAYYTYYDQPKVYNIQYLIQYFNRSNQCSNTILMMQ